MIEKMIEESPPGSGASAPAAGPAPSALVVTPAGPRWKFARYLVGSLLATATSAVVFAVAYSVLHLGPRPSTAVAFVAGAVVNFAANRFWAWGRRRRAGLGRDALAYAALSLFTAVIAAQATATAESHAAQLTDTYRAVVVESSYFAVYGAMFLVKFLVLDRIVFATRSRSQVEQTTRV
jgi:putative flippase GtrA